jgi:hypothetical protein
MSQPSKNYLDKIVRWACGGIELQRMNMRPDQRFRAALVMNAYRLVLQNPTSPVRTIVRNIAQRDYELMLRNAEMGDQDAKDIVEAVGIRRDPQTGHILERRETEIANDIYCVNQLVGRLNVSQNHLDKLLYQTNVRWLSTFGQQTGNVSAIKEAQRGLEVMNNGFKDEDNPADAMRPGAERNITGDISIIKPDRTNYSDEVMRKFAKQIGAKWEDVQEFMESEDGTMVPVNDGDEDEEEEDTLEPDYAQGVPTDEPDTMDPFNR